MEKPANTRGVTLQRVEAMHDADVLIIGAGINGAGTFRELCLNGVRCLLVDAEDFGAGATSASTRIAHGGLRYLENGEIRLVAEATRERNRLLRNAPHYVTPLLITIPFFSWFGGLVGSAAKLFRIERPLRSRGLILIKTGLAVYDWLGRSRRAMPLHSVQRRKQARRLIPALHPAVRGIASYYDARISHAERLAFELVSDGLASNPASVALNHCRLVGLQAGEVALRDEETGSILTVRPKLLVNASGAWIDAVNGLLGAPVGESRLIGGTKGSHILVENKQLREAIADRCFSYDDGDGRMCVAYAMEALVLLGSSDIRVNDPDEAVCDDDEVAYFLRTIRLIFPSVAVDRSQIRYRFCGVRPLPFTGTKNTVNISRDHSIHRQPPQDQRSFPVLSLVGGKWTTFRAFAEQATDRILGELGRARQRSTCDLPIGGGRLFPAGRAARARWIAEVLAEAPAGADRLERLLRRYGTTAAQVARFCAEAPDVSLPGAPTYSEREVRYLVRFEMARTIEDLVYRRMMLAMEGQLSFVLLMRLASILADELGCGIDAQAAAAGLLQPAIARLRRENGVDLTGELEQFLRSPELVGTAP